MAIDSVNNTTQANNHSTPLVPKKDSLGRDAFLQLLTTQLAHQDPTKPQADGEFIAQLAQFSSLEQLTQIQQTLTAMSGAMGVDLSALTAAANTTKTTTDTTKK